MARNALVLPITKNAEWWAKPSLERHAYFYPHVDGGTGCGSAGAGLLEEVVGSLVVERDHRAGGHAVVGVRVGHVATTLVGVARGDRVAEWDPAFSPVITETGGIVKYQDLIENRTMSEQVDESTGITQRVVTEDMAKSKKDSLHPRLTLTGKGKGEDGVYRLAGEGREDCRGLIGHRMRS